MRSRADPSASAPPGVHGVLIASVHRLYKKCARCALNAIVFGHLHLGAHSMTFCALLGQGVCTLAMSTLLDLKCPQNT
jgi:hypothetical protein